MVKKSRKLEAAKQEDLAVIFFGLENFGSLSVSYDQNL